MSNFSEKTQFDFLFDALVQKYPGIQNGNRQKINSMFQFSTTPLAARWVTGVDAEAYDIANVVPLNLDGFYVKGESLDQSYKSLIQSIKPVSGDVNDRYVQIVGILNSINNAIISKTNESSSAYKVWSANNLKPGTNEPSMTYSEWMADRFGGIAYLHALDDLEKQRDEYLEEQEAIMSAMGDSLKDALKMLLPENMQTMDVSKGGQASHKVPLVSIGGDLPADQLLWTQRREGEYDLDVTINSNSVLKSDWVTVKETKIEKNCFKTSVTTNINTKRIITDTEYNLRFKIVGLGSYNINRGNWFMPSFVDPSMEIVEGSRFTNDTFFGSAGCLHLLPENVLVMYKPSFELTITTKCFEQEFGPYINTKFDWIEIFGFRVDLGPGGKITPINQGVTTKLIFNSPVNAVSQIVGITSKVVYNGR